MDIERDLNIITSQMIIGADRFQKIYNFPTENVKDALSNFDFKDKNCLTTMGSSFQMIEMYLKGASKVTTFDINRLTIYYFYFVKAFIKSKISVEEYMELFTTYDKSFIDKTYKKISKYLDSKPKLFWDSLYDMIGSEVFLNIDTFNYVLINDDIIKKNVSLFDKDKLDYLRHNIKILKPNFINCNIRELPYILKENYDVMYLSNIMQYSEELYNDKKLKSYDKFKELINKLSNNLNENGKIYCNYLYDIEEDGSLTKYIIDNKFVEKEYSYETFIGYDDYLKKDAVLVYKK